MLARNVVDNISFNDPAAGVMIADRAGTYYHPLHDICIVRRKAGRILGGVLYTNYTGESVAMHTASWSHRWINRDLLWVAFDYPFNQMNVKRIFGQVPEDNWRALSFNRHAGFKDVTRIDGVYAGGIACIVMKLERDECRFLDIKPRGLMSNIVDEDD